MRKKEGPKWWGRAGAGLWILMIFTLCAGMALLGCPLGNDPEDPGADPDTEVPNPSGQTEDPEDQSGPAVPKDPGGSDKRKDPAKDPAKSEESEDSEDSAESGGSEDSDDPAGSGDSEDSEGSEDPNDSEDPRDPDDPNDSDDPEDRDDPEESENPEESEDAEESGDEEEPEEIEEEPEEIEEEPEEIEEEPAELILSLKKTTDRGISVEGLPEGPLQLSQTGKDDLPRELRFRITGYTQSACWVDGKEIPLRDGDYVISALNYGISRHRITCMGVMDGIPYGREIKLVITE